MLDDRTNVAWGHVCARDVLVLVEAVLEVVLGVLGTFVAFALS